MFKLANLEKVFVDGESSIDFKTSCACEDPNHSNYVSVHLQPIGSMGEKIPQRIIFSLCYTTIWHDEYGEIEYFPEGIGKKIGRVVRRGIKRIKAALKILFHGYIETTDSFVFRDEEHAKDFGETIIASVNLFEQYIKFSNKPVSPIDLEN